MDDMQYLRHDVKMITAFCCTSVIKLNKPVGDGKAANYVASKHANIYL